MAVVAVTATWLLWNLSALGSVTAADATLGTTELVFATVMAVSAFAQALTGFGFAIISVGCLSSWLVTSPLFALVTPIAATLGAVVGAILLLPDVKALDWDELIPLLLPCTLLTPGGVWLATIVNPSQVNSALGVLILAFVTFLFADAELPPFLASKQAAYLLGAVGGVLGGAYDVQGPPLVVCGKAKHWEPQQFRNNILCIVAINSAEVVLINSVIKPEIVQLSFDYSYLCLLSLPGVLVGLALGRWALERINPQQFKQLLLMMCSGLAVRLLLS